jgi:hypothetical protein
MQNPIGIASRVKNIGIMIDSLKSKIKLFSEKKKTQKKSLITKLSQCQEAMQQSQVTNNLGSLHKH